MYLLAHFAYFGRQAKEEKQETIDREIARLEEVQRGYEAEAIRHEMLGNRLQFRSTQYALAKQHWEIAEEYRMMAQKVELEIARLQKQRAQLEKTSV